MREAGFHDSEGGPGQGIDMKRKARSPWPESAVKTWHPASSNGRPRLFKESTWPVPDIAPA